MASRKRTSGSKTEVRDLTVEILKEIRDQVRTTNERLEVHGRALVKLIGEVHSLNDRFDNFLTGAHGKEHDELRARVERIEKKLERTG